MPSLGDVVYQWGHAGKATRHLGERYPLISVQMETVAPQYAHNAVRQSSLVIEDQHNSFAFSDSFRKSCFMSCLSPKTSRLAKGKENPFSFI